MIFAFILLLSTMTASAVDNCGQYLQPCQFPNLTVKYAHTVVCNENFPVPTYRTEPKVSFPDAVEGKLYTILMSDPDTTKKTVLHWVVSNVDASQLRQGELGNTADILAAYRSPGPPKGTGTHRYQFLLLEQVPGKTISVKLPADGNRGFFDVPKFLSDNQLCNIVAGIQFTSQYSE